MDFSHRLLLWYDVNKRSLPWRDSKDAYKVWISEVILQQTRIDQGVAYYERFLKAFPDVAALAAASEDEVLRLWQGLGYYSRARNLHHAARKIVNEHNRVFPKSSNEWIRLKGVGPYTAAAIASIVFNEVVPALDGNVYRVLARVFTLSYSKDSSKGKQKFFELASHLIHQKRPGDFNQALMDFGSLICKPAVPLCPECPLNDICLAFEKNSVSNYPVRNPKRPVRERHFNYFRITTKDPQGNIILFARKREENDIWMNMYDLPLLETASELPPEELFRHSWWQHLFPGKDNYVLQGHPKQINHKLTHQLISARIFYVFVYPEHTDVLNSMFLAVSFDQFESMAKPRLIELLQWDAEFR